MRLTISLAGDTQINRELVRISDSFTNMQPAFDKIATDIAALNEKHFETEGGFGEASGFTGGGWAPLSPLYKAWKDIHWPGQPILVRTGALRKDVTARPFGVEDIGPFSMEIGTTIPYAKFHQFGTPRMPMRKVMDLTTADRESLLKVIQTWVMVGRL